MKRVIKIIAIGFLILLIAGVTAAGYFLNEFLLKRPAGGAKAVSFTIEKGDGVKKIGRELKSAGIIDSTFVFEVYVWLTMMQGLFQPGDYNLKPGGNISGLVGELTSINIEENNFTIIEGWTLKEMAEYLRNKGLIKTDSELYYLTGTPGIDYRKKKVDFRGGWNYDFLSDKPSYISVEGYVYPDTYRILAEAKAGSLIKKALDNFDKKLTSDLRVEIKKQGKTIFEVVTLASIVEKEVSGYENRRMVADIFLKRLKAKMPLESDATINYITGKGMTRPLYGDLKVESPYNTYKYAGLPLGPINNPSIEAIMAVIYPASNPYYYFLTDESGKVYYGKTYAEHLKNKAKYLK